MKSTLLCVRVHVITAIIAIALPVFGQDKLIEVHVKSGDLVAQRFVSGGYEPEEDSTSPGKVRDRLDATLQATGDFVPGDRITIRVIYDDTIVVNAENLSRFAQQVSFSNSDELPGIDHGFGAGEPLEFESKLILGDDSEIPIVNGGLSLTGNRVGDITTLKRVGVNWVVWNLFEIYLPNASSAIIKSFEVSFTMPFTTKQLSTGQIFTIMPMYEIDVDSSRATIDAYSIDLTPDLEIAASIEALLSKPPLGAIADLINEIDLCNLANGIANSLDAKIDNAVDSYNAENAELRGDAINKLLATINAIEAQRGNKIDDACANILVAAVIRVIDAMILFQ